MKPLLPTKRAIFALACLTSLSACETTQTAQAIATDTSSQNTTTPARCELLNAQVASPNRVTITVLDAPTLTSSCEAIIKQAQACTNYFEQLPLDQVSTETLLNPWDKASSAIDDVFGPVYLQTYVHPEKSVRDAGEKCIQNYTKYSTGVFQNENLYRRFTSLRVSSPQALELRKDIIEAFEDSGVNLPADKRARAKAIIEEAQKLSQEFSRNMRDNKSKIKFSPAEVKGVPENWKEAAEKDADGNYLASFDYPVFNPFMRNASNGAARKRYLSGYYNRGTPRNLEILDQITTLRKELATLQGVPSYAHLVTKRRMVQTPEVVHNFLNDVAKKVHKVELNDIETLRRFKASREGTPLASTVFNRWDLSYYTEQLRKERFQIDQEALRTHFPTQPITDWAMYLSGKLYGIRFNKVDVPVWHQDVQYYDVFDTATNERLGGIYLDMYPRDGKYKHAAAFGVREGSTLTGRKPISVLVTNFDRKGLTHRELETLMHEFGHVLHGVLSKTHFKSHSGTNVSRDFVEAPSQMFEAWVRRPEALRTIQDVCRRCPPLSNSQIKRLEQARLFGQGTFYSRQHLYASLDMALVNENPKSAAETWETLESASPLGHIPGTQFPGTFGHIAGGYASGYYGYMWSEVLAVDMLSRFGNNIMNLETSQRFRKKILERGGERPALELVEDFLGRKVNSDAFFAQIAGEAN